MVEVKDEEVNKTPEIKVEDNRPFGLNRKTRRSYNKLGIDWKPVPNRKFAVNPDKEFKAFRKELALKWGSQTGKLKKKHINNELKEQGLRK